MGGYMVICLESFPLELYVDRVVRDLGLLKPPMRSVLVEAEDGAADELRRHPDVVNVIDYCPQEEDERRDCRVGR